MQHTDGVACVWGKWIWDGGGRRILHFMDHTPDVSDFNYEEEEGGDYGENDDNGNDVY